MRKSAPTFSFGFWLSLVLFLIAWAGYSVFTYYREYNNTLRQLDDKLLTSGSFLKDALPTDFFKKAVTPDGISEEEDEANIKKLTRLARQLHLAYFYTLVIKDNTVFITSSSASEEELAKGEEVRYWTKYMDTWDHIQEALKVDRPTYHSYRDRWGKFRSVYIPYQGPDGSWHIIAAELGNQDVLATLKKQTFFSIGVVFLLFCLGLPMVGFYVHDTRKANAEIAQSAERLLELEDIINMSPVIAWQWKNNADWSVEYVSDNVTNIGYAPRDFYSGKIPLMRLIHPEDLTRMKHEIEEYSSDPDCQSFQQEFRILTADGKIRYADVLTNIVREKETGVIARYRGIIIDSTEKRMAREEHEQFMTKLKQSERLESIGKLAGGVAHDFNNMLTVIMGYGNLLKNRISDDSKYQDSINAILGAAGKSAELTGQLLAFARKQNIAPKRLNLNHNISHMLKMLRRLIGENISLEWVPSEKDAVVEIDPTQLDQILTNMVINSKDAVGNKSNAKITIESDWTEVDDDCCKRHPECLPGKYVMLVVSDNGEGMDEVTLDRLFEPFYTTKKLGEGTGLGMATVYGIIRQNNGFVDVYSEVGRGTTFKIYLPESDLPAEDSAVESNGISMMSKGGETILIVEDEADLLEMGREILEDLGYHVLTASNGPAALRIVEECQGDIKLLITDVVMPEMNGRELAEKMKPGIKCLFMSGYTNNVIAHHNILEKGVNFIQKPFVASELGEKIRHILDND